MTVLEDLQDDDGLVLVTDLTIDPIHRRKIFLTASGQRVYLDPRIFGVADIILASPNLSAMAKLRISLQNRGRKGAPVYGVTFKHVLAKLNSLQSGKVLKSMYKVSDEESKSTYGVCATLIAHLQKKTEHIQIEVWQYIKEDSLTSYLHGILNSESGTFTHFDGATISHTPVEIEAIFEHGVKGKGSGYLKQFRLDGEIKMSDVIALATAYLPNQKLAMEYFERTIECAA